VDKAFTVSLCNPDKDTYVTLELPADPYAVLDAWERLRLAPDTRVEWEMEDYGEFPILFPSLQSGEGFPALNALAERLTSLDQLHELIPRLKLRGFGGTDFRPVFAYVDRLLEEKKLTNLNGLLYFTDGVGTYPEKSPAYKTAFIFNRDDHISPHVPSWAIRAVLTTDNIRLLEPQKTRTEEDTESWI